MRRRRPFILAGGVLATLLALVLLAPLVVILGAALSPSETLGVTSEQWAAGAGAGRAFEVVLDSYRGHLVTSAEVALAAGAVALALGAPAGLALGLARGESRGVTRGVRAVETLVALPLAIPGLVVAIALLVAYPGRGGALGLLVVGHVLYTLPYAVRIVAGATRALDLDALLDAARTLGAGRRARVLAVAWPSLRRAIATSLLMALTVSWGEFNVTFLLATPSSGTFPTALYLTYTTNSLPVAAAATALFLAGLAPLVLLAWLVAGVAPRAEQGA